MFSVTISNALINGTPTVS